MVGKWESYNKVQSRNDTQDLLSTTGLIIDGAGDSALVLGQGCLIVPNRMVTCASIVCDYLQTMSSLVVHFKRPDVRFAVTEIRLHPDFKLDESHAHSFAQDGSSDMPLLVPNDIAVVTLGCKLDPVAVSPEAHTMWGTPVARVSNKVLQRGDALTGFYLDRLTGEPFVAYGEFLGVADEEEQNWLLHSIPFPKDATGALVLLGNQLVGLNTGARLRLVDSGPGDVCEMIGIDALSRFAGLDGLTVGQAWSAMPGQGPGGNSSSREVVADKPRKFAATLQEGIYKAEPPSSPDLARANGTPPQAVPAQERGWLGKAAGFGRTMLEGMLRISSQGTAVAAETSTVQAAPAQAPEAKGYPGPRYDVEPSEPWAGQFLPDCSPVTDGSDRNLIDLSCSVALVFDRTTAPWKLLGQGGISDKKRLAVPASIIANYVNAPWAVAVKFPKVNKIFGVKAISLHPDFNSRYARMQYLAQTGTSVDAEKVYPFDLSQLVLDENLDEINSKDLESFKQYVCLSIPEEAHSGPVDASGIVTTLNMLGGAGSSGLAKILDDRNCPVAQLLIDRSNTCPIKHACFQGLTGHHAVFELAYRGLGKQYSYQLDGQLPLADSAVIEGSLAELIEETRKRLRELPGVIEQLGGSEARYARAADNMDIEKIHPSTRWIAQRVWKVLDGHVTVDKLWQRTGVDTFTSLRGLNVLRRLKQVVLVEQNSRAPRAEVGLPLLPKLPEDLQEGDSVYGLFIDPVTEQVCKVDGYFRGRNADLDECTFLHTVAIPPSVKGGLIFSERNVTGFNLGRHMIGAGNEAESLYEMLSVDTLLDLKTRRQRVSLTREMKLPTAEQISARTEGQKVSGRHQAATSRSIPPIPIMPEPEIPLQRGPLVTKHQLIHTGIPVAGIIGLLGVLVFTIIHPGAIVSLLPSDSHKHEAKRDKNHIRSDNDIVVEDDVRPAQRPVYKPDTSHLASASQLDSYAEQVQKYIQKVYRAPKRFANERATVRLSLMLNGQASGVELRELSNNPQFNRYLADFLFHKWYPPGPYVGKKTVDIDCTINGANVRAAIAK